MNFENAFDGIAQWLVKLHASNKFETDLIKTIRCHAKDMKKIVGINIVK